MIIEATAESNSFVSFSQSNIYQMTRIPEQILLIGWNSTSMSETPCYLPLSMTRCESPDFDFPAQNVGPALLA